MVAKDVKVESGEAAKELEDDVKAAAGADGDITED